MGTSTPPPAAFDLVGSFARRRGADVQLVFADPKIDAVDSPAIVTVRAGSKVIEATGTLEDGPAGRRLVVQAPTALLTDGVWRLDLRRTDDQDQQLEARLLVQGRRPIVLLWGAKAGPTAIPKPAALPSRRKAAAATGGRVLDQALTLLPEGTARAVRTRIRRTARKVLR